LRALILITFVSVLLGAYPANATEIEGKYKGTGKDIDAVIDASHKTILGLELGVATLENIKGILGEATAHMSEDPHEPDTYCYSSTTEGDDTVVIIESGPRCGPSAEFAGFIVAARDKVEQENIGECYPSNLVSRDISTFSSITLGISKDRLIELLGNPTIVEGDIFQYIYDTEKPLSEEELEGIRKASDDPEPYPYVNVFTRVVAEFKDDELVRISMIESESY